MKRNLFLFVLFFLLFYLFAMPFPGPEASRERSRSVAHAAAHPAPLPDPFTPPSSHRWIRIFLEPWPLLSGGLFWGLPLWRLCLDPGYALRLSHGRQACRRTVLFRKSPAMRRTIFLPFCNNASPMFLSTYLVHTVLGRPEYTLITFLLLYCSMYLCSLCFRVYYRRFSQSCLLAMSRSGTCDPASAPAGQKKETSSWSRKGTGSMFHYGQLSKRSRSWVVIFCCSPSSAQPFRRSGPRKAFPGLSF